jgi:histidinol dehydrogenase|nr:MAG: histidinol dehydrogenase [Bacteroidota bacterium]
MLRVYRGTEIETFFTRRRAARFWEEEAVEGAVRAVLEAVRQRGDRALRELSRRFDGIEPEPLRMPPEYLRSCWEALDAELQEAFEGAIARVRRFHEAQRPLHTYWEPEEGVVLGWRWSPIARVGVYVPGGRAAYPSTIWMSVVPAQVAGVPEIALVSPPDSSGRVHPLVAAVAWRLGLEEVYAVGGAQAIAALAYGTESIRAVDKIVGPGNAYVTTAKRLLFGYVGIDSLAGPSEIAVVADETARPDWVLADLLSQAEHDVRAMAVLLTPSEGLLEAVGEELRRRWPELPRRDILEEALREGGACLLVRDLEEAISLVNRLAPEHLELYTADPWSILPRIQHAGAVFLGPYTPEAVGDYWAGPSHVLPTSGTARFSSGLSVWDFLKRTSLIAYDRAAFLEAAPRVIRLAQSEGLPGHAEAMRIRLR